MNKEFFQQIFQMKHGYVYRYAGTVPDGENVSHYITNAFAISANTNLLNTMVVELPRFNITVIYVNSIENLNSSLDFELITNLVPDLVIEQIPVVEEATPPA